MTAGGNLLYFYLLDHVGPTKTQSVAFLVPVFALLAGVLFFGEPLTRATFVGLGIIFAGVVLVMDVQMRLPRMALPGAMVTQLALPQGAILLRPAITPTDSRPSRAWSVDRAPVYDRHSTRRHTNERRPAMCA